MDESTNKTAILIAEAAVATIHALGMKTENDARIQQGLSYAYRDSNFSYIANELNDKIENFKKEIETK